MPQVGQTMVTGSRALVMPQGKRRGLTGRQRTQVKKLITSNQQVKQLWLSVNNIFTDAGTLQELTTIGEGNDFDERNTDRIKVLSARLHVSIGPTAVNSLEQTDRVMIVRSKRGPLLLADLPGIFSAPDLDKFQVLLDRYLFYSGQSEQDQSTIDMFHSFKKGRIPHMKCIYDDDVSATAC